MIIYKDIFTGDELASDSCVMEELEGSVYKFTSKMVTKTESGEYNIGANNPDPDAEVESEEIGSADSTSVTVNLLADNHRLQSTTFDKATYTTHIKNYMKRLRDKLKETNPTRAEAFQKQVQPFVAKVLSNMKDYDFWTGESMDFDNGMVVLMNYAEDGITPYFYVFKDGVKAEKV